MNGNKSFVNKMYRKIYNGRSDYKIKNHEALLIPYNPANRLIMPYDVEQIIKKFGHTIKVKNIQHYREALTHKSYVDKPEYNAFSLRFTPIFCSSSINTNL